MCTRGYRCVLVREYYCLNFIENMKHFIPGTKNINKMVRPSE